MNVFDIIYDENTGQSLYVSRATGEVFAPQND